MQKSLRLVFAVAALGIATWASAWDYPTCASLDGFECDEGRLVCDNGPTQPTGACTCKSGVWECLYGW
jgi:hypothetical protein